VVIVDQATEPGHITRMRAKGINVVIAAEAVARVEVEAEAD